MCRFLFNSEKGSYGTIDIAKKVVELCDEKNIVNKLYNDSESIKCKIEKIATQVYKASYVNYSKDALSLINLLEKNGCNNLPICIAKTPLSISDDPKKIGYPKDFSVNVEDVYVQNGAGFIVVLMGDILTMPGLGKNNCYEKMLIDDNGKIKRMK